MQARKLGIVGLAGVAATAAALLAGGCAPGPYGDQVVIYVPVPEPVFYPVPVPAPEPVVVPSPSPQRAPLSRLPQEGPPAEPTRRRTTSLGGGTSSPTPTPTPAPAERTRAHGVAAGQDERPGAEVTTRTR